MMLKKNWFLSPKCLISAIPCDTHIVYSNYCNIIVTTKDKLLCCDLKHYIQVPSSCLRVETHFLSIWSYKFNTLCTSIIWPKVQGYLMVSKANELFIALEQILDIFEDGLLLGGGRRVVPLEKDAALFTLWETLRVHLFRLRLHLSATSSEEKIAISIFN